MIIIDKSREVVIGPSTGRTVVEKDPFLPDKIPPRRQWNHSEVVLNGKRTGVIILRKNVIFPHEVDVEKTRGSLRLIRKT